MRTPTLVSKDKELQPAIRRRAEQESKMAAARYNPANTYPKREWVIEGLAALGSMVGHIGPEKSQKSIIGLRKAMHVACGKDFFGFRVPKARLVVYFDAENPVEEIDLRYKVMLAHFSAQEQADIRKNLTIVRGRELIHEGVDIEVGNASFWESFIKQYPAEVYILDAFQMFHSKNEISNREIKKVLLDLRKYCGRASCLVIVHHTRKRDDRGLRDPSWLRTIGVRPWSEKCLGAGVFKRLADVIICQELYEKREGGEVISWTVDFAAFGRIIEDVPLLQFQTDGDFWHNIVRKLSPAVQKSYEKLKDAGGPWPSKNAAATVLNHLSRSQANVHASQLIQKQYLRTRADGSVELV
jgi:hypothetical protein